ncbi:MAG: tetratricopeptide repeat protein [Bacteroidia bacterium]
MARIALLLSCCLLASGLVVAQNSLERDSLMKAQLARADWVGLRASSRAAVEAGFETYAFVLRLALAELELGYWWQAERQLLRAIALNPLDSLPLQWLADLYQKTGRSEEAALLRPQQRLQLVVAETGIKQPNNDSLGRLAYQGLVLKHRLHRGASLTHAYTRLQQALYWGDFVQQQYYLRYNQAFKSGWLLTVAGHWLQFGGNILFDSSRFDNSGAMYALELRKKWGPFDFVPQYALGSLYARQQQQWGLRISYSPARYSALKFELNPMMNSDSSQQATAMALAAYWYPGTRFSAGLSYYRGNGYNFQEQAGYLVNNGINLTRSRLGVQLEYGLFRHFRLYGLYQLEQGTERFFNFDYRYHSLFAGIKYQP